MSVCAVICGKLAERIRMPFEVGGPSMFSVHGYHPTVMGNFGGGYGAAPIVTNGEFVALQCENE